MRMTADERALIEHAASCRGESLTQWSMNHLITSARQDIQEATKTILPNEAFDALLASLEQPTPQSAVRLLEKEPMWTR